MKIVERIRGWFGGSTYENPQDWFFQTVGARTDSGVRVNHDTALTLSWVWQAVQIISNDIGRLPVLCYDRSDPDNRQRAIHHPAYKLMKQRPNPYMTPKVLRQVITANALLHGNGICVIVRDGRGAPLEIYPLNPSVTRLEMVDGEPVYITKLGEEKEETALSYRDVLHIKNLSTSGFWGLDTLSYARHSFGLGLAGEKHGSASFSNNARPSVVLQSDGNIDQAKAKQIIAGWEAMHKGVNNAGKTALLTGGLKAQVLSMSNENAQWLESRKFQRQEVASWFLLPASKLNDDSTATSYNSIEQQNRAYADQTLMNWIVNWEQELNEKLLTPRQRMAESHEFEFLTAGLLRADLVSRYQSYQIGISSEFLSPNEVRKLENMPQRIDGGGDVYRNPNTKSGEAQKDQGVTEQEEARPAEDPEAMAKLKIKYTPELQDALRDLVRDRVDRMVRLEANKIKQAAASGGNFLAWAELFYDEHAKKVHDALWPCFNAVRAANLGGVCDFDAMVSEHIERGVERLLAVTGSCKQDELAGAIQKELNTWHTRTDETTTLIMEG